VLRDLDRAVGAERVERAVGEVHHPAHAEDERQPERDQQVIPAEDQAVDDLLEKEKQLHESAALRRPVLGGEGALPFPGGTAALGAAYSTQAFADLGGLMLSSGWFGAGTAAPNARMSHLSFAWPLGLTVNGKASWISWWSQARK